MFSVERCSLLHERLGSSLDSLQHRLVQYLQLALTSQDTDSAADHDTAQDGDIIVRMRRDKLTKQAYLPRMDTMSGR